MSNTLTLLKYGQTSGGKKFSDAVMLLNLRKSFDFVINNLDSSLNEGELKTFIKDSHAIISKDLVLPSESRVIRNSDVLISGTSYKPLPPGQKLEDEFRYLCNIASNIQCPLNKAVYLHNNLCYLQYFVDCNKRTARNIMAYTLMNNGVFPILFSPDSKKDYIQSIIHYYETGEYNLFKQYFLSQIELMNKFLPQDENCFLKRKGEGFKI